MNVVVFFGLVARDGRNTVEVRRASSLGEGYIANPKATVYSCAYDTAGRNLALRMALDFCNDNEHCIVHVNDCESNRRAGWQ